MSAPPTTPPRLVDQEAVAGARTLSLLQRSGPWLQRSGPWLQRSGPWLLRGSLAIVLLWFGALKVAGVPTMPGALIAAITPSFLDADLLVLLSGVYEVVLGLGLLLGRWQPLVLAGIAGQMSATFLVLLIRPDVAFLGGNPLTLSVEGEYVIKNVVLLAAALVLAGQTCPAASPRRRPRLSAITARPAEHQEDLPTTGGADHRRRGSPGTGSSDPDPVRLRPSDLVR